MTLAAATKSRAAISPARSRGGMGNRWIHSMISLKLLVALAYCPQCVLLSAVPEVELCADGKPCIDIREKCPLWAAAGECDNNAAYMGKYCRLSCDHVLLAEVVRVDTSAEDALPCIDIHENCLFWATTGECEDNKDYMGKNCRLSCDPRCDVTRAADESEVNAYIESSKAEIEAKAEMNAYIESRKVEIEAKAAENKAKLVLRGEAELY